MAKASVIGSKSEGSGHGARVAFARLRPPSPGLGQPRAGRAGGTPSPSWPSGSDRVGRSPRSLQLDASGVRLRDESGAPGGGGYQLVAGFSPIGGPPGGGPLGQDGQGSWGGRS
jgi:hypothetical protein